LLATSLATVHFVRLLSFVRFASNMSSLADIDLVPGTEIIPDDGTPMKASIPRPSHSPHDPLNWSSPWKRTWSQKNLPMRCLTSCSYRNGQPVALHLDIRYWRAFYSPDVPSSCRGVPPQQQPTLAPDRHYCHHARLRKFHHRSAEQHLRTAHDLSFVFGFNHAHERVGSVGDVASQLAGRQSS